MAQRHIKLALRKLLKNKFIFSINVLGLALGIASFTFLQFYVGFENGYDAHHENADNIYRVESAFLPKTSEADVMATSSFGYGPAMKNDIPEVESYCRVNLFRHQRDIKYKDIIHRESFVVFVDSNFFNFFSFPLIDGNKDIVLSKPNSIVISEHAAAKYFGNKNPIGETLEVVSDNNKANYTVTGVFKNISKQSHLQFDFLLSYPYSNNWLHTTWYMHEAYTYVSVAPENVKTVEQKFTEISETYKTSPALKEKTWLINLTPLKDIHLNNKKSYEHEAKGSRNSVIFLRWIAIILIIASWANYINLSSSKNIERLDEMEIFRFHGARFVEIIKLLIAETSIVCLASFVFTIVLLSCALPLMSNLGIEFSIRSFWGSPATWSTFIGILILGLIVTSLIPSMLLYQLQQQVHKVGQRNAHLSSGRLREALVTVQFVMAIVLIVITLITRKQNNYLRDINLGVAIDQTLVIPAPANASRNAVKMKPFKEVVQQFAGEKSVTISSSIPGKSVLYMASNYNPENRAQTNKLHETLRADEDYIDLYGLELAAGRNFIKDHDADNTGLIINETSRKLFEFKSAEDAIGKQVYLEGMPNTPFTVIGVLKDYHHMSAKESFQPIVMVNTTYYRWIGNNYISVKLESKNLQSKIAEIENAYNDKFTGASFNYFFLDDKFNEQYKSDLNFGKVFTLFTWLGIVIVCLGLLGLTNFILVKRTKEIGVRKVNGARTIDVLALINKSFVVKIAIAFLIACPISYFALGKWLETFAYKTALSWWVFAIAGLFALVTALITVSWQSWRAASRNPVEALRYE